MSYNLCGNVMHRSLLRVIPVTDSLPFPSQHDQDTLMPNDTLSAMRQSIIDGASDTASTLAQQALVAGVAPIDAINNGYVPGMHAVGEQFARGQMFLPDMMASAEAMRGHVGARPRTASSRH